MPPGLAKHEQGYQESNAVQGCRGYEGCTYPDFSKKATDDRPRNEAEANGYGPPRRPQRGYHGKRDLKPRDE